MHKLNNSLLISIISHGHKEFIIDLLNDLDCLFQELKFEVVLTINSRNEVFSNLDNFSFKIHLIGNKAPKGFGANHNQAFQFFTGFDYFLILNPDIRIMPFKFSFLPILKNLNENPKIGVIAPLIRDKSNQRVTQLRRFPTFKNIFLRNIGLLNENLDFESEVHSGDWIGGMFMLLRSSVFKEVNGFDERNFYMYLEDSYLCYELSKLNYIVCVNTGVEIMHYGQHKSKVNLKHFLWHLTSLYKFIKLTRTNDLL